MRQAYYIDEVWQICIAWQKVNYAGLLHLPHSQYSPAVCAYYNTIFFSTSINFVYMKIVFVDFFFSFLFLFFFFFVFPAFSLHFYSQTNFLTSNWQKLTSSRAMDRQMYGEHTRDRERERQGEGERETQLTDCLIDRSQSRLSQSVSQSDRKQNRLWKMIPAVKRSTYTDPAI